MNKLAIGAVLVMVIVLVTAWLALRNISLPVRRQTTTTTTVQPTTTQPPETTTTTVETTTTTAAEGTCTPECFQETDDVTIEGAISFTLADCTTENRINECADDEMTLTQHVCVDSEPGSNQINCNTKCKELGYEKGSCPADYGACLCECTWTSDLFCPDSCPSDPDCEEQMVPEE